MVEYILLFVIVVACSVTLARSVPSIFSGFVDKCSSAMTGASSVGPSHSESSTVVAGDTGEPGARKHKIGGKPGN